VIVSTVETIFCNLLSRHSTLVARMASATSLGPEVSSATLGGTAGDRGIDVNGLRFGFT